MVIAAVRPIVTAAAPESFVSRMKEVPLTDGHTTGHRLRRNITLGDRRTSVSLEAQIWQGLTDICQREGLGIDALCTAVDRRRGRSSMSSALRVFLLLYFRDLAGRLATQPPPESMQGGSLLPAVLNRFRNDERAAGP